MQDVVEISEDEAQPEAKRPRTTPIGSRASSSAGGENLAMVQVQHVQLPAAGSDDVCVPRAKLQALVDAGERVVR